MLSILKYNKASVVFCIILILLLIINPVKKSANGDGKPDIINLIKKHNLDILDIPVSRITHQYIEYIELIELVISPES